MSHEVAANIAWKNKKATYNLFNASLLQHMTPKDVSKARAWLEAEKS